MMIMIGRLLVILLLLESCRSLPQYKELPDFRPIPQEETDGLSHPQNRRSIGSSSVPSPNLLQETVDEVEAMIKSNPDLPRLTRGEILDLLENITRSDYEIAQLKSKNANKESERNPKAIMVVQAYTPESDAKDMEELFTKPPVTHIIANQQDPKDEVIVDNKPVTNDYNSEHNEVIKASSEKPKKSRGDNRRRTTSTTTSTTTTPIHLTEPSLTTYPEKSRPVNPVYHRRRRPQVKPDSPPVTRDPPITTYSPKYRKPLIRRPTTTEKHPNHKYLEELPTLSIHSNEGLKVIQPPQLTPNDAFENADAIDIIKKVPPVPAYHKIHAYETTKIPELNTALPIAGIEIPEHLKGLLSEMVLGNPKQHNSQSPEDISVNGNEDNAQLQSILAAYHAPSLDVTTTTTSMPDISNVAANLTPEMRDLLMSFGLIPNPQEQTTTQTSDFLFSPVKAEVKPESYIGFKPLPDDGPTRDEMEDFLTRFGLGRNGRNFKLEKKQNSERLSLDMVPENYKGILEDIGITSREGKKIRSEALKLEKQQHVFSPDDTKYASENDLDKLSKLLNIIKQLEQLNRTATDEDLKKIDTESLKELVNSLNVENHNEPIVPLEDQSAPNPLNFDVGSSRNEVKRQPEANFTLIEDTATLTGEAKPDTSNGNDSKTAEVQPSTVSLSTVDETATPNIQDLEDSFGGKTTTTTEAPTPETTTPMRRTGFYMLIDWNSFLDIDDQKGKRVNLRFQPKIGDPKRFYSVSVP